MTRDEDYYSHISSLKDAKRLLVERDNEFKEMYDQLNKAKKLLEKAQTNTLKIKRENSIKFDEFKKLNPKDIEVYSSNVFKTVFDYEEDSGMPYYCLPEKDIANELLIESGLAMCDGFNVRIHLELVKETK